MLLPDAAALVPAAAVPAGSPLASVVSPPTARQPCLGLDEPFALVDAVEVTDAYAALGILPPRPARVRREVHTRLGHAGALLPDGFGLVVLDATRTTEEQRVLLDHYGKLGPTGGYVASLDADAMRPPHLTGGAVDVTLSWRGRPVGLGTDFDSFRDEAHLHAFENDEGVVRDLRRLLASVLAGAGFAPFELEWWHWSYGDDVWASARGCEARYDVPAT
jgi:zinc D-Ala-D-Ala dipeptidase